LHPPHFPLGKRGGTAAFSSRFGLKNLRIFTSGNAVKINLETGLIVEKP
jgi:hypothetical protein